MQNDVLKNNIAPWQEKGRWYHVKMTESGIDNAKTDKFMIDNLSAPTNSGSATFRVAGIIPIDVVYVVNNGATTATRTFTRQISLNANKTFSFPIPRADQYTALDCDLYIFCIVK